MRSVVRRKRQKHTFSVVCTAICITVLLLAATTHAGVTPGVNTGGSRNNSNDGPITPDMYVPGQVVVKPSSDTVSVEDMALGLNAVVEKHLAGFDAYLLEINPAEDPASVSATLSSDPGVAYAHPNYLINPLHPVQGSYPFSDEQLVGDYRGQLPAQTLKLADAHNSTTGQGVTVGVIDCGVDYNHTELAAHMAPGWDFVDNDSDPMDVSGGTASGHGTFVAGIINLVAPDAEIRAYRVIDETGFGDGYGLAEAIQQAVLDGCDVINISVVLMADHPLVGDVIQSAREQGVTVVVAAGNEGEENVAYPAADPGAIAVAAVDSVNLLADFSSYGSSIDVCAPGTWIYSTYLNNGYAWWSGTSFAAPFVAGQAALLKALYPTATPDQIQTVINGSADDISIINPAYIGMMGSGLVDPPQAFTLYSSLDYAWVSPDTLRFIGYQNETGSQVAGAYLTSGTGPTPFTAEVLQTGDLFVSLSGTRSGLTNDTIPVQATVATLAPGTYYNTVRFTIAGVSNPVDLVAELTVNLSLAASISPDTIVFTGPSGIETFAAIQDSAFLASDNAPAQFLGQVIDSGLQFIYLIDSAGVTDSYIRVVLDTSPSLSPGTYYNHVSIAVNGVAQPVPLTVVWNVTVDSSGGGPDSVWVEPSEVSFTVDPNELAMGPIYVDHQDILIRSTNEPAAFIATTLDTINAFAYVDDSTALTGDTTQVYIAAGSQYTPGNYYNTIRIEVPSLSESTYLLVEMIVVGDTTGGGQPTVMISPYSQFFRAPIDSPYVAQGSVYITSTLGASNYTAALIGTADFLVLSDTMGVSEDSFYFEVNTGQGLPEGLYTDTIGFWVEGATSNPKLAIVYLITGDSIGTGLSTVTVSPYAQAFNAPIDSPFVQTGSVYLSTTKGASAYTAAVLGTADFIVLNDTTGVTEGNFYFDVNTGSGLPEGIYTDTLAFWVSGAAFNPQIAIVYLTTGDSVGSGLGNVTLSPTFMAFYAVENEPFSYDSSLFIHNTKGQYDYTASVNSPNDFTVLHDTAGFTETDVHFTVESATGLPAGLYIDTIAFLVNNSIYATNPKNAVLYLQVTADTSGGGGGGTSDSAWTMPDTVVVDYDPNLLVQWGPVYALVASTNQPANYSAWVTGSDPIFASLPDTLGATGDSVQIDWDATGLATGTYYNYVNFGVAGITQPAILVFELNVIDSSSSTSGSGSENGGVAEVTLRNYPNPFNPATNISFALPQATQVRLEIFNVLGQRVRTLVDREMAAGEHTVVWDGNSDYGGKVASGVYFYRIQAGEVSVTRKMMMLK